jgi:hypothetical protein
LQLGVLSGGALITILVTVFWIYSRPAHVLTPPPPGESLPESAMPETLTPGAASVANPDELEPDAAVDPVAKYKRGVDIIGKNWRRGEAFKLVDGVKWIRAAAESGHHQAEAFLGRCYETGRGVIQDYTQAVDWYERAAVAGNAVAMGRLGEMFSDGRGVEPDLIQAYQWLNLAAARGVVDAERARRRVQARMSDEQLLLAQEASRQLDRTVPNPVMESPDWPAGF